MIKNIFFLTFLLLTSILVRAQADYKVVFDLTSKDSLDQRSVIRWLREISGGSPDAQMEVVMYGQGIALGVKGKSYMPDAILQLAAQRNITFKVCAIALKNQGIDPSQLLPGITTTPDGIYEIIQKQNTGWGYIKVKN